MNVSLITKLFIIILPILFLLFINQFVVSSHAQEVPSFIAKSPNATSTEREGHAIFNGIELAYNNTWEISTDSSKNNNCLPTCLFVLENKNDSNIHMSIFSQHLNSFADDCKCKSLVDFMTVQYDKNLKTLNITAIKDNQTELANDTEAWQMEYTTPNKNKNYNIWFINDNFLYELSYYDDPNTYLKYLPEIKSIINSIQFNNTDSKATDKQPQIQRPSFLDNMSMLSSTDASNLSMVIPTVPSDTTSDVSTADTSNAEFSTGTTIKDIINIHNSGVSFGELVQKIASDAQNPLASVGQVSAWDSLKYTLSGNADICSKEDEGDSMMNMLGLEKGGHCNILMSFTYETCKAIPTLPECTADKNLIDTYISDNNLGDKTNDYAYEFLEILSSRLNQVPSNTIDEMIYFSGEHNRMAVAYIEGRLKAIVG